MQGQVLLLNLDYDEWNAIKERMPFWLKALIFTILLLAFVFSITHTLGGTS